MEKTILANGSSQVYDILDTTKNSLLHRIFYPLIKRYRDNPFLLNVIIFVSSIAVTILPLVIIALYDLPSLTKYSENVRIPFLYDYNMLFMFIISFPLLVIYYVTDQFLLIEAIRKIIGEGILHIPTKEAADLYKKWTSDFSKYNIPIQAFGLAIGLVAAYLNYIMWSTPEVGFWILKDTRFSITGWVYLYCVFLFFFTAIAYALRIFVESLFLRDLARSSKIRLEALHPDGCGGLSAVGRLGLRHQYILTIIGVNLLLFYFYNVQKLNNPEMFKIVMILLVVGYLIVGPLVFFSPLLPFRDEMANYKSNLINDFSHRLQEELNNIRSRLQDESLSKEPGDIIGMLRNIITIIQELPVWPLDIKTLRKFFLAYIVPLIPAIKWLINWLTGGKLSGFDFI